LIVFRSVDARYPFLWESSEQPSARWHAPGEGPAHYFATTADGAWAEFLRHEEITDPEDLLGVARAMWVVVILDEPVAKPALPDGVLLGGLESYTACQAEARRLRSEGFNRLEAPSAALESGGATIYRVDGGPQPEAVDSKVIILFGHQAELRAQLAAIGRPSEALLGRVRPLVTA
jgi:hypothetical protein